MIHIVFNEADIATLQQAIDLDNSLEGNIIQIKDDFAVGPIMDIYTTEGYKMRRDWWQNILEYSPYTEQINIVDDKLTVHNLLKQLTQETSTELWLWMGQNAHDVCGYYWLMSQLKDFQGHVQVLYLNNLPFINEKGGIFYPTHLYQIQPKEFIKAKKLARPITLSEFEGDPDEWDKLSKESAGIRLLEGGKKLVSKNADYYDKDIIVLLTEGSQKLSKIINHFASKPQFTISDVIIAWRLRTLASMNKITIQGNWEKGWKEMTFSL